MIKHVFNPQEFRFMKHQQQPHVKYHKRTPSGTVHVTADTGVKIKMSPPKMFHDWFWI